MAASPGEVIENATAIESDDFDIQRQNALWATVFSGLGTIKEILLRSLHSDPSIVSNAAQRPVGERSHLAAELMEQELPVTNSEQVSKTKYSFLLDESDSLRNTSDIYVLDGLKDELEKSTDNRGSASTDRDAKIIALEVEINQLNAAVARFQTDLQYERKENIGLQQLNDQLYSELAELRALISRLQDRSQVNNVQSQTEPQDKPSMLSKEPKKGKAILRTESLDRGKDVERILSAQDAEIRRLRAAAVNNSELMVVISDLRRQLSDRSAQVELLKKERESVGSFITCENAILHLHTDKNFSDVQLIASESYSRVPEAQTWTGSLTSLHSDSCRFDEETAFDHRLSRRASQNSVSSRTESYSFRYNDNTPSRMEELERRNRAQKPHLKSSYPVESRVSAWRQDPNVSTSGAGEERNKDENAAFLSEKVEKHDDVPKKHKGFFKKIQDALHVNVSTTKEKNLKNSSEKFTAPVEKSLAFTIQITPEKKTKSVKAKKAL
ncbi:uncharacterized protein LOC129585882 isoform X2 [Paramacrobiotus metropolitanus]|uniref:uncharacterized protein LOC129585882 isoform X2 n=1 Tax=Paramacrobiotus metropolitanus TaxID=2943436 RepID=UPI002445719A|nr:uncharacterized protein LOC129585882 isoform X2 [Paramacrobiotus metropolitanus]